MSKTAQQWRALPGYPSYEVSNRGWVRNLNGYVLYRGGSLGVCVTEEKKRTYLSAIKVRVLANEAFAPAEAQAEPESPASAVAPEVAPAPDVAGGDQPLVSGTRKRAYERDKRETERNYLKPARKLSTGCPWATGRIDAPDGYTGIME